MPNLFDYLDWRGDLTFEHAPFSEIDNLILSELSYIDFSGLLQDGFSESLSLDDASERLSQYRLEDTVETGLLLPKTILPLFYMAAKTERFRDVRLTGFAVRSDAESETQFAAVTFLLGDGTAFVAYRGTDDTLVGWKEDFNMTFLPVIPAQSYALQYLSEMAEHSSELLRIGGHSKGGNLAVYAAASAPLSVQKRIVQVFNNDGPGFSRAFLDSQGYARIRDRVQTIVPKTSIVGMLLEHEGEYTVVESTQSGLFQHNGFSWEVCGTKFVRAEALTEDSRFVDRTLKNWVGEMDDETREAFVEAVYAILSSTGGETLADIRDDKEAIRKILKSVTPEQRAVLQKGIRELIYAGQRVLRENREERRVEKAQERMREEEARLVRRAEREAEAEKKKKRREALMVAVRPIRFRIVKAEPIKRNGDPSSGGEE